jgi:hypothetical protein
LHAQRQVSDSKASRRYANSCSHSRRYGVGAPYSRGGRTGGDSTILAPFLLRISTNFSFHASGSCDISKRLCFSTQARRTEKVLREAYPHSAIAVDGMLDTQPYTYGFRSQETSYSHGKMSKCSHAQIVSCLERKKPCYSLILQFAEDGIGVAGTPVCLNETDCEKHGILKGTWQIMPPGGGDGSSVRILRSFCDAVGKNLNNQPYGNARVLANGA